MKKNFSKTLGQKNKIISFYDEDESVQRKYFFKFIGKIYAQAHRKEPDLKFADFKPIKLVYIQPNSLKIMIFADVDFIKDQAIFSFERPNGLFASYISQKFRNSQIFLNDTQTTLAIKIQNKDDIKGFDELFSKSEHMRFCVNFSYDEAKFVNFKRQANMQNSQKFIKRFSAIAGLFEEYFEVLGCELNDSFESVRSSYLRLVKLYHPDRHANKSEKIKSEYRLKFEQIQHAYESLRSFF